MALCGHFESFGIVGQIVDNPALSHDHAPARQTERGQPFFHLGRSSLAFVSAFANVALVSGARRAAQLAHAARSATSRRTLR